MPASSSVACAETRSNKSNMVIYNVTVQIEDAIREEWLDWMRTRHIPDVLATGLFARCNLMRVVSDDDRTATFAIQYECPDLATLERYRTEFAPALQRDHTERYKDRFVAFRTVLERVDTLETAEVRPGGSEANA